MGGKFRRTALWHAPERARWNLPRASGKFQRGNLWKLCLGKLPAISSLVLSAWRRWFGLKLEAGNCRSQLTAQLTLASGNWSRPFPPHDRRRKSPFDEIRINAKKQSSFGGLNFHISSFNFLRKYPNPATPEAGNWKLLRAMFQPRTGLSRPQAAGLEFTSFHVCIELSTLHAYKTGLSVKLR